MLIDTGANKNYLSPRLVNKPTKLTNPTCVVSISGKHVIENYVKFNPFPNLTKKEFMFHLFDFHKFFHGLIGYEMLQQLDAKIDATSNTITILGKKIKMFKKYPTIFSKNIEGESVCNIELPVSSEKEGDFYIEDSIEILPNLTILPGLYHTKNHKAFMVVENRSNYEQVMNLDFPIQIELNNFDQCETGNDINFSDAITMSNRYRKLIDQLRLDHLNTEEKTKLLQIIDEYQSTFFVEGDTLSNTSEIKHLIYTKDEFPVYQKSYRYPHCHKDEVSSQMRKMLNEGIIRHSNSPWNSPIWVVPKKKDASGKQKWRIVVDYRKLNAKTVDDKFPIPNITDILDKLGRSTYFTTLDLASGFYQIEMDEKDIAKTAFSTDSGHYEYVRMPFGLKNAPATFQRLMNTVLKGLVGVICLVYMDDIIVFSTSLQEHYNNLAKVMNALENANLKVQLDKSDFLQKEVAFLGHIVSENGVKPNPDKLDAIKNWPIPKTEKDIKSFLGTLGYYRRFIKDFSRLTKPLTQCLRKDEKIVHTKEFLDSFEKCKQVLTSSCVLQYPDFNKQFNLTTDASNYAIGAVLSQGPIGRDRPIAFASRTLNKHEEKYSTIEKELLAIFWETKYFRPYLFGQKFILFTDHKPLTGAMNLKDPSTKIAKWMIALMDYSYDIQYKAGKQNVVADGLSRIPQEINAHDDLQNDEISSDSATQHSADTDDSEYIPCTEKPVNSFPNQIILRIDQNEEENFEQVFPKVFRHTITKVNFGIALLIRILKTKIDYSRTNCIHCPERLINSIQIVYKNYFSRNKKLKIYISQNFLTDLRYFEEQNEVIETIHEKAHRGIEENLAEIKRNYYFPNMKNIIRQFILVCKTCQKAKYERHPYKIMFAQTPIPKKPLDIVHLDIFITQPNIFISAIDKLSKFGMLIPIKSRSLPDIKSGIIKLITTYGCPKLIVCDNEPSLRSPEIQGMLLDLETNMYFTALNKSEMNGIVERFHSTLSEIYRCIKDRYENTSKKQLFRIALAHYNKTIHSTTNLKPSEIFYGIKEGEERPLNIDDIITNREKNYDEVIIRLKEKQNADLTYHNKTREIEPHLNPNDEIYIARQGIKNKTKDPFIKGTVKKDRRKTFEDIKNRKLHKTKMKRRRRP